MPTAVAMPPVFGRYKIEKKLGEGGMGAVYLAEDTSLGRKVALKVPFFSDEDEAEVIPRFQREARVAAALDHPNICTVHDIGAIDGIHYLTMPFIDGKPLNKLISKDKPWPTRQAAELVRTLAFALDAVHQKGVMHRDLKPANIMMKHGTTPIIMDFGLARSSGGGDRLTVSGAMLGTPAYMSPEQVRCENVGLATDIYTLGVIFYELLTGQVPFAKPFPAVFKEIEDAEPTSPSALRIGVVDAALAAICLKAMTKQPKDRYPTMAAFAAALDGYLQTPYPPTSRDRRGVETAAEPLLHSRGSDRARDAERRGERSHAERGNEGTVPFPCPNCSAKMKLPLTAAGKKVECPKCKTRFRAPADLASRVASAPGELPVATRTLPALTPPGSPTDTANPSSSERTTPVRQERPRRLRGPVVAVGVVALVLALIVLIVILVVSGKDDPSGKSTSLASNKAEGKPVAPVLKPEPPKARDDPPAAKPNVGVPKEPAKGKEPEPAPAKPIAKPNPPAPAPKPKEAPAPAVAPFDATTARQHQQRWADYLGTPAELTNSIGMKLVLIPPGRFVMGSPADEKDRDANDENPHEVGITKPFYAGVYEVTQEQYEKVMGTNPANFKGPDRPVEMVSWENAVEFCKKLSQRDGRTYRLPTEAEWEYACRGGTTTVFHYGNSLSSQQANFDGNYPYGNAAKGNYLKQTTKAGAYAPNGFGLFDMHGNVWEWCQDYYDKDYYGRSPTQDPVNEQTNTVRVLRGGSWDYYGGICRSADRIRLEPTDRGNNLGFRVVCSSQAL